MKDMAEKIAKGKGKGKGKDVEITGESRPYKGMWQDSEESETPVKSEPVSDDENLPDAGPPPGTSALAVASPDSKKKLARPPPKSNAAEPVLQTEEDKLEYQRFKDNQYAVRQELGPEEQKVEARNETSYLFQFPAKVPHAQLSTTIKPDPEAIPDPIPDAPADGPKKAIRVAAEAPKKKKAAPGIALADGRVGTLRVHDSGRATLYWGTDVTFDLTPGIQAGFRQETIDLENVPKEMRVVPNEGGDGGSLGPIYGMFVAAQNWKGVL